MGRGMWLAGCLGLLWACGGDKQPPRQSAVPVPDVSAKAGGVLIGRVRLADGFELPEYSAAELERRFLQVGAGGPQPDCAARALEAARRPIGRTPEGYLTGVAVVVSEFSESAPQPPRTHEVVIRDCRLTPSLLVATKGDKLILRNEVPFPFMPMLNGSEAARSLLPGQQFDLRLNRGGARDAILCAVTAPCGRTDVLTLYHSLHSVTDGDGRFRIERFPTDEAVKVNVWHPLIASATQTVELGIGQEKDLEFVVMPKAGASKGAVAPSSAAASDRGTAVEQP